MLYKWVYYFLKIYLFERQTEREKAGTCMREGEGHRERSSSRLPAAHGVPVGLDPTTLRPRPKPKPRVLNA